jgi:hypothetical protein
VIAVGGVAQPIGATGPVKGAVTYGAAIIAAAIVKAVENPVEGVAVEKVEGVAIEGATVVRHGGDGHHHRHQNHYRREHHPSLQGVFPP